MANDKQFGELSKSVQDLTKTIKTTDRRQKERDQYERQRFFNSEGGDKMKEGFRSASEAPGRHAQDVIGSDILGLYSDLKSIGSGLKTFTTGAKSFFVGDKVKKDVQEDILTNVNDNITELNDNLQPTQLDVDTQKKMYEFADEATTPGSIYTHDIHSEPLIGRLFNPLTNIDSSTFDAMIALRKMVLYTHDTADHLFWMKRQQVGEVGPFERMMSDFKESYGKFVWAQRSWGEKTVDRLDTLKEILTDIYGLDSSNYSNKEGDFKMWTKLLLSPIMIPILSLKKGFSILGNQYEDATSDGLSIQESTFKIQEDTRNILIDIRDYFIDKGLEEKRNDKDDKPKTNKKWGLALVGALGIVIWEFFNNITHGLKNIANFYKRTLNIFLIEPIQDLWSVFKSFKLRFVDKISKGLGNVSKLQKYTQPIVNFATWVGNGLKTVSTTIANSKVGTMFSNLVNGVVNLWGKAGAFTKYLTELGGLSKGLISKLSWLGQFAGKWFFWIGIVWDAISGFINTTGSWSEKFGGAFKNVWDGLVTLPLKLVGWLADWVGSLFGFENLGVKEYLVGVSEQWRDVFANSLVSLLDLLGLPYIEKAWNWLITSLFGSEEESTYTKLAGADYQTETQSMIGKMWDGVLGWLKGIFTSVIDTIKNFSITDSIGSLWDSITGNDDVQAGVKAGKEGFNSAQDAAIRASAEVAAEGKSMWDSLSNRFENWFKSNEGATKDVAKRVTDGAAAVVSNISNVTNNMINNDNIPTTTEDLGIVANVSTFGR